MTSLKTIASAMEERKLLVKTLKNTNARCHPKNETWRAHHPHSLITLRTRTALQQGLVFDWFVKMLGQSRSFQFYQFCLTIGHTRVGKL